jgi:glycosyltransferase involved in cell wall biosynthesis
MLSVIIPSHNRAVYLKEAIDSVLCQVPKPLEVIVVDDGSTDGTWQILNSYNSSIAAIRQPRMGVSGARNAGIRRAKGEWIAFLDSDDLWLPGKLAAQVDYLHRSPSPGICQTQEIWIRNGKRLNPSKVHKKPQGECFTLLLERCLVSPSAVMIHRAIFDEVGLFDESLPACEDYDLWLRIGCRYPVGLIDKSLIIKRGGHADQLSATVPALDRFRIQSIIKLLRGGRLKPEQEMAAIECLRRKSRIYVEGCFKRGKSAEAEEVLDTVHRTVSALDGGTQISLQ